MTIQNAVETFCLKHLRRMPNLDNPKGYNDKIQWLKLNDQMPEQVICCDKYAARGFVAGIVGEKYLLQCYQVADKFSDLTYRAPCMVKANHDSGGILAVRNREDWKAAEQKIAPRLSTPYGVDKGEWSYARVKRRCMTEQLMPEPIVDYKFHCAQGRILWVQLVSERKKGTQSLEHITDVDGKLLPLHMDDKMRSSGQQPDIPETWAEMCDVARALSQMFRYVRVDLYSSEGRIYFGELTFWPKAGNYKTPHEPIFGAMLDIDMSFKRERLAP